MNHHKVIIDLDNAAAIPAQDPDDALALALALTSPEIELLACTACAGNCRTRQSAENSLRLLEVAGREDIPVALGRETPLLRDRTSHFHYLENKTLGPESSFWKGRTESRMPRLKPSIRKAHDLIIDLVNAYPDQIALVCLGSLTNLALALLAAPEIAKMIKAVIHMGGAFVAAPGSPYTHHWHTPDIPDEIWRDILRFNTAFDPEAAAVIFRSGVKLTFITVNVTKSVFQTLEDVEDLAAAGTPFHQYLHDIAKPWVEWSMACRKLPGAHMHDPLTVAALIDRSFCRFESMHLDTDAFLRGEFPWLQRKPAEPQVEVAVAVDSGRFERFLARRLLRPVQKS